MKKYIVFLLLVLAITPVMGLKVIYDFDRLNGESTQLTTDTHYDRNPSFFEAVDGTYWLFFTRSVDGDSNYDNSCEGMGCDQGGCLCDGATYEIYYITSSDEGETWTSPVKISSTITNSCQRDVAAFLDDNDDMWVFTASGSCGTNSNIYYYKSTDGGITWPRTLVSGITGSHLDATQDDTGTVWLFVSNGNTKYITSNDYGANWSSSQVLDSTGAMPKVFKNSTGELFVVYINSSGDGVYLSTYDGGSWNEKFIATSGLPNWGDYDPTFYQDNNGYYWVFFAPWDNDGGVNKQWIEYTYSPDGLTWSLPVPLTDGGHAGQIWWDMWPEAYETSDGNLLIFYTSEMNTGSGYQRGDGNIWMFKTDVSNDVRFGYLTKKMVEHENRISFLESWRDSVQQVINNMIRRLDAIENFITGLGQQPVEPSCGNEVCETWFGENHDTCPNDCPGNVVDGEVFISEHWRAECPATFDSYMIDECRVEVYRDGALTLEETLKIGQTKQVNQYRKYTIKLYGKISP